MKFIKVCISLCVIPFFCMAESTSRNKSGGIPVFAAATISQSPSLSNPDFLTSFRNALNNNAALSTTISHLLYSDVRQEGMDMAKIYVSRYFSGNNVQIMPPVEFYRVNNGMSTIDGINKFTSSNIISDTSFQQYIYHVTQDGKMIGSINIINDKTTAQLKVASTEKIVGTDGQDFLEAIHTLTKLKEVSGGTYEVRILQYGVLNLPTRQVLWLKSKDNTSSDLIYFMRINSDLNLAAGTLITAAEFISKIDAVDVQNVKVITNATAQENKLYADNILKAKNGSDTATSRLIALQIVLNSTLLFLKQSLPSDVAVNFTQPATDIIQAQATVADAINYLKTHPHDNQLVPIADLNSKKQSNGFAYRWSAPYLAPTTDTNKNNNNFQQLRNVYKSLTDAFYDFIGDPSRGIAIIGEIGINRDAILRDVSITEINLARSSYTYMLQLGYKSVFNIPLADPTSLLTTSNSAHSGSISGLVIPDKISDVDQYAILIKRVDSLNSNERVHGIRGLPGSILGTISNDKGAFVISNVPAGFYALTTRESSIIIEVSESHETIISKPLLP